MRISVFGLGYVGAVSAACLARDGHHVIGCDIDTAKLDLLRNGRSPIAEPGVPELVAHVMKSAALRVTSDVAEATMGSELSFVCVGTPALASGGQDLAAIRRLIEHLGDALRHKADVHLVVIRSTVLPGTTQQVIRPLLEERSGKTAGVDFDLCFQPEFLREGSSLQDFDRPPLTVVGAENERAVSILRRLYASLPSEFHATSTATAELLKYACNAFHALKVAFANEVGRIGSALEIDARMVMDLLGRDTRLNISTAYLRPGLAFGGPCLPKDLRALIHCAARDDVPVPLLSAILPSNDLQIHAVVDTVLRSGGKSVGILGLSFKAGTDDLRESPLARIVQRLVESRIEVKIYDPDVASGDLLGANRQFAAQVVPQLASQSTSSCDDVVRTCDVLVIARNGPEVLRALRQHTHVHQGLVTLVDIPNDSTIRGTRMRL